MKLFKNYLFNVLTLFSILLLIFTIAFFTKTISANDEKNNIVVTWETPEEGTAVSFNSDNEYAKSPPILLSSHSDHPLKIKTSIDLSPILQRLILPGSEDSGSETEDQVENDKNNIGIKAAQKAIEFYEKKIKTINVNGSLLNIETDCSYFVRAAYWEGSNHTMDLFRESISTKSIDPNKATGVTLLASYFKKNHRYNVKTPEIGDIIIFDNTYDKNHNQQRDDNYTHTGIVTAIREDNTIEFIHGNIGRTIKKGFINFTHKDVSTINQKPVNSYIRPHYSWENDTRQNLASYLVRAFGGF
ncbi:MAG: CHAP domain-containing protein [Spirochaetia bacterium]|nr:CHAP domain-containing protein [Spirochaetia bacterium]